MKILLTGSTGQVGQEIIKTKPPNIEIIKPCRKELDLSNFKSCMDAILIEQPDWVINCGAYTSVEGSEINFELATRINSLAPKAFAKAINEINGNLLQISSDYVFDGLKDTPYCEDEKRNPCNRYGYTKALGEQLIEETIENIENATILRTSWIISSKGENFITKILKNHSKKTQINVVSDQLGSPTSAKYLAKACWKLIELKSKKRLPFILHWTDLGTASWYELALEIGDKAIDLGLLQKKSQVIPIKSSDYPSNVKRPKYSVLNIQNSSKILQLEPKHWRINLKEILMEFKKINLT